MVSLSFSVRHDLDEGIARLNAVPARADAAMIRATEDGTILLRGAVQRVVEDRTKMASEMVSKIIESEVEVPAGDSLARGRISFTKPPAYFYPKKGQFLRFTIGSRVIFARRVKGSRPYKLIPRAAEGVEREIGRGFEREVGEVFR